MEGEEDIEYTHVMLPYPGCDINGVRVCMECEDGNNSDGDMEKKKTASVRIKRRFSQKLKEEEEESEDKEGSTEEDKESTDNNKDETIEKRAIPIFCAVCLMEFAISERVCWASNRECSHCFHEDCMLKWLISLGRKRSKRQRFPLHPSEKRLLDFELACPCCRQEFISKNLVLDDNEGGEDSSTPARPQSPPRRRRPLPWWKRRKTKLVLGTVFILAVAFAIALGVSFPIIISSNDEPSGSAPSSLDPIEVIVGNRCFADGDELKSAVDRYEDQRCAVNTYGCEVVRTYGWPMNSWCVGNVTDMSYLFAKHRYFNGNISEWDTSRVTTMEGMFKGCKFFSGDISRWNTSSVTSMYSMFAKVRK